MTRELSVDESRLSAALVRWFSDLTHQGIFATDRDLRIIVWNRWMEVHSDLAASEVLGRALTALYPDLIERGLDQYYRDALAGRISVVSHGLSIVPGTGAVGFMAPPPGKLVALCCSMRLL